MTTFTAIVRKESRQQGALAVAMVLFCLVLQFAAWLISFFPEFSNIDPAYFAVAVLSTALFTGAATAISFSGEQEDGTFAFLRNLPISARTVFFGKAAWLLLATLLVLAGTSLLALFWEALPHGTSPMGPIQPGDALNMFGIGIVEVFAWGLFWSPRCRSQMNALLATYFCASTVGYYVSVLSGGSTFAEIYGNGIPLRLTIAAVVGALGVWNCLKWFDRYVQRRSDFGTNSGRGMFDPLPYPKRLQRPFFALLHQSIRQSQTLLLVGLALSLFVSSCFLREFTAPWMKSSYDFGLLGILVVLFYFFFCAGIFAQDQKNESFRFLSRCGISARTVWWSRVLPFFVVTLLTCIALFVAWKILGIFKVNPENDVIRRCATWYALALFLIPFSTGAFFSISCRYMIVAAALSGAASVLLFCWMLFLMLWFGLNPFWTTLPLCVAFLVASRLRTSDWLRERRTWRSRFKAVSPILLTVLAILLAIPPVRIYSVPYVSLDKIEPIFGQFNIIEQMSPEWRRERFRELRANLTKPLTNEEYGRLAIVNERLERMLVPENPLSSPEEISEHCKTMEKRIENFPTFDAYLIDYYELNCRRSIIEPPVLRLWTDPLILILLPWESKRLARKRDVCFYEATLLATDGVSPYDKIERFNLLYSQSQSPVVDRWFDIWDYSADPSWYRGSSCRARLLLVRHALYGWYLEHDNTLPESLDELVGSYLTKVPTDPFTGEAIQYEPERDDAVIEHFRSTKFNPWQTKPGWPKLKLYGWSYDLHFLPGYDEYGSK